MAIELTDILVALGNFPLLEDISLLGGFRTVSDLTERDAIDPTSRKIGMFVWVVAEVALYRLENDITNDDWVTVPLGGSGSPNDFVMNPGAPGSTDKVFTSLEGALAAANNTDGIVRILFMDSTVVGNGEASIDVDFSNVILVGNAGGRTTKTVLFSSSVTITALPLAVENLELIFNNGVIFPSVNTPTFLTLRDAKVTSAGIPADLGLVEHDFHISLYGASSLTGSNSFLELSSGGTVFVNAYDESFVEEAVFTGSDGTLQISLFGDSRNVVAGDFTGTKSYRMDGSNAFYQEIPNDQSDFDLSPYPSQIVYVTQGGGPQPITLHIPDMIAGMVKNDRNWILVKDASGTASTNTITIVAEAGGIDTPSSSYVIDADFGAVLLRFVSDNFWLVVASHNAGSAPSGSMGDFPINANGVFVGPGGSNPLHIFEDESGGQRSIIVYNVTISAVAPFGQYASFHIIATFTRANSGITERDVTMVNGPATSDEGFNVVFEIDGTTISMAADSPYESHWRAVGFITVISATFGEA